MTNFDGSRVSVLDRCAHRAAAYLRTKTRTMKNAGPIVSFTFDDIPESAFTSGATILDAHGVKGTFYIAGALCGVSNADRTLVTARQCLELFSRGHEIGCHTFSHCKVGSLTDRELHLEIGRNQTFFASLDPGIVLENFAYPFNRVAPRAKMQLQQRFHTCREGGQAINVGSVDLGMVKSVELCEGRTNAAAVADWVEKAIASDGWLVFLTHDVSAHPTQWGCSPELLETAVSCALSRECRVLPVRDVVGAFFDLGITGGRLVRFMQANCRELLSNSNTQIQEARTSH